MNDLIPDEKRPNRGFVKWWYIVCSAILGGLFINSLVFGGVLYHWYQLIMRIETHKLKDNSTPDYKPREAFKNLKKVKATNDLRYYAQQLDLDLQEYKVTTKDGYILTLHRLIDPKDSEEARDRKHPILLQHGLLSSSGCFLTSGYNSLSYYLVQCGYDVWMGNNRSWFLPEHETLKNLFTNETYWDWDVRDLGFYDLPCLIDNVLAHKPHHHQLTLSGHSQGSTQSFLLLKNPELAEYHKKINLFIALAPAIFPGSLFHHRFFLKFMHSLGPLMSKLMFGTCDFAPILTTSRKYLYKLNIFGKLSYYVFKYLFGWNGSKWGQTHHLWHIHFIFNVSFVSAKLMNWWLSEWRLEGFSNQLQPKEAYINGDHCNFTPVNTKENAEAVELSRENTREKANNLAKDKKIPEIDDSKSFFPYKKAWFGGENSTVVPMLIFTGKLDFLVDGDRLVSHMRHYETAYEEYENLKIVELDDHSHLDVVWGEDVIGRIGYVMRETIDKHLVTN